MGAGIIDGTQVSRPQRPRVGVRALAAVGAALAVLALVQPVANADKDREGDRESTGRSDTGVKKHATKVKQEGSFFDKAGEPDSGKGKLKRTTEAVTVTVSSTLIPGDAATVWWIVFNDPARCRGDELSRKLGYRCGTADREQDHASMLYAGGAVAGKDGSYAVSAKLPRGDVRQAAMGMGLTDPYQAEVQAAIRTHGPASKDETVLRSQLTTMDGGCRSTLPLTDPMRGIPGENTCKTLKFTFFVGVPSLTMAEVDDD